MGRTRKTRKKRHISIAKLSAAIHKLGITKIRKTWRDESSEFGLLCCAIGIGNNGANRRSINDRIKKTSKGQTNKRSPKPKYRDEEYRNVFRVRRNRLSLKMSKEKTDIITQDNQVVDVDEETTSSAQVHASNNEDSTSSLSGNESLSFPNFEKKSTSQEINYQTKTEGYGSSSESTIDHDVESYKLLENNVETTNSAQVHESNNEDSTSNSSEDESIFFPNFEQKSTSQEKNYQTKTEGHGSSSESTIDYDVESYKLLETTAEQIIPIPPTPLIPKISVNTLSHIFGMDVDTPFFTRDILPHGSFKLTEDEWHTLTSKSLGRSFHRGSWQSVMLNGVSKLNPYCTFMVKNHQLNKLRDRKSRKAARIFSADFYCKFTDCTMTCHLQMDTQDEVQVTFSGKLRHNIEEQQARPISGVQRTNYIEELTNGQKPYKFYLKKFSEIPDDVKIAGNMSGIGNTPNVIRQISSEAAKKDILDDDEVKGLKLMASDMIRSSPSNHIVKGFIQHISILPNYVMYWNETGVRLWHELAKGNTVFWDATGSVIRNKGEEKKFLYYELTVANPVKGQPSIPVSAMISSSHDTPQIHYWLGKFRLNEKKIFGHFNTSVPSVIISDRSLVFLISALLEFNKETMGDFTSRIWRILGGNGREGDDEKKMIPHGCLAHIMKDFKSLCKKTYQSNFEYGMYLLSLLVNVDNLLTATKTLKAIMFILLSSTLTPKTLDAASYVDSRIQALPDQSDASTDNVDDSEEGCIFEEKINPNRYTEEQFIMRGKNEFFNWATNIRKEVLGEINEEENVPEKNKRQSESLADKLIQNYISTFPIWSNILIGHLQKNSEGCLPNDPVQRKTNATAEQRFRVLKDVSLSGQKINRIDVFSQELKNHTEAIQKLGSLKSIKKPRKPMKKASVLIEEKWDKKTPMKRAISGKYQSKPKKMIKTVPLISNQPSNTAIRQRRFPKIKKQSYEENSISYPDTKTNETENLNTRPNVQEQKEMTDLGKPPSYHSADTIRNRALRLYNEDSRYLVTAFNLDNSPYLNEIYTQMSLQSCKPYMIQSFKDQHSQLKNTENNCWFNSVVQLLKNSYLMMDVNENFINDLSYREGQRHILKVFHNAAIGNEITSNQLENALHEANLIFGMQRGKQNDAHEFISKAFFEMSEENDANVLKMIEANMCMNCGDSMNREVIYNDIQLEVASHDVQGYERLTELLDIYFTDEELDVNLCCIGSKKFKGFRIGRLPQEILVTVLRYKMNTLGRALKISTPILMENVVNFGKYTQPQSDVLYRLKGVILHHGSTPRSGHYTTVLVDGAKKVELNDSSFTIYEGNKIMTNSYIALYEQINSTEDISCSVLSDATRYLCELESFRIQMECESEVDGISVRKVKILRSLSEGHDDSKYVTELLRQGVKTLSKKPISSSMKDQMNYILTYCFGQNPSGFKERFGLTSIQVLKCPTCDFNEFTEVHDVVIDSSDITRWNNSVESQKLCVLCRGNLQTDRKIVTYIGQTLLVMNFPGLLNDIFDIIPTYTNFKISFNQCQQSRDTSLSVMNTIFSVQTDNFTELEPTNFLVGNECISLALTSEQQNIIAHFDAPIMNQKIQMDRDEMLKFHSGHFSDKHIDCFFMTICNENLNYSFMPAAWFRSKLLQFSINPIESNMSWFDKELVLIPVNTDNHWLLLAIQVQNRVILYLDPLGHPVRSNIVNRLYNFTLFQSLIETKESPNENWNVLDLMKSGHFPRQSDFSSCGAMVCLYSKMLVSGATVMEAGASGKDVRMFLLNEVIQALYKNNEDSFGLQTIIYAHDMDDIVHGIVTNTENNERHNRFMENPEKMDLECTTGFGSTFLSREELEMIKEHLLWRYFVRKKSAKMFTCDTRVCTFVDATFLNNKLSNNLTYGLIYLSEVLVKEVVIELLHRLHEQSKIDINADCIKTEIPIRRTIKEEVDKIRMFKKKLLQ